MSFQQPPFCYFLLFGWNVLGNHDDDEDVNDDVDDDDDDNISGFEVVVSDEFSAASFLLPLPYNCFHLMMMEMTWKIMRTMMKTIATFQKFTKILILEIVCTYIFNTNNVPCNSVSWVLMFG